MTIDLNHGSGFAYGRSCAAASTSDRLNALIDAAVVAVRASEEPRRYLGASRVGEPCSRRLAFEVSGVAKDKGRDFDGRILRIFEAGHSFEALSILWLRQAGFDLRTRGKNGEPFGFSAADGRFKGHIDGVIIAGPEIGITWPALWEHKALKATSWNGIVRHGLRAASPVYFAQAQIYMAYLEVGQTLFTILNKDTQALHHERVPFDAAAAQALSDKAVAILRAIDHGELPPRIAASPDFHLCRMCPYAQHCWESGP